MHLMHPWTPLSVTEEAGAVRTSVYGRTYTADARSPFASILSQGKELLAAPMRILMREDGEDYILDGGWKCYPMAGATDAHCDLVCAAESTRFSLNVTMGIDFDGCIDATLTVAPRGRTVAMCFGMEQMKPYEYRLERLVLELSLRRDALGYFQFYPQNPGEDVLSSGGEITGDMHLAFKEQVFITGDDVGLLTYFPSEEGFMPLGGTNTVEILPNGDTVTLRIHILEGEPAAWRDVPHGRIDLDPISFAFGMMATPVKPMPERRFEERAVHIDCYKKIAEDYEDYLSLPFEGTDEVTFDRLARLGVNTLYIHEKWNDLQNSPILTAPTARRLAYIVKECHARGIRVIPYFGYEMSMLAPYFREMRDDVWLYHTDTLRGSWYRQPPQRDIRACQCSRWSDFFCEGIDRLMTEYGFDGIYLDGTAYARPCKNTRHGCGFYGEDGKLYPTYPVLGNRRTMMRLYEIVCEKHGGIINCHAGSAFNMPALSFSTSLWDGEVFQSGFLKGEIDVLPDRYFRALYTGRNIGVPIYMLTYLNPPIWDFQMALSTSLPFGIIPKPNDAGEPLEILSGIWRVLDEFGVGDADFLPYYGEGGAPATTTDPEVRVSAYRRADGALLLIVATTARDTNTSFTLTAPKDHIRDALTGEALSENGKLTLSLCGFAYRLLIAE